MGIPQSKMRREDEMKNESDGAYEVTFDENRSIAGKPVEGATLYRIENGSSVKYISLTYDDLCAMLNIMRAIEADKESVQPKKEKKAKATP